MDTQLQSISKIFTERLYRIPDYQRGYAWTEKQLKDFWNDILQLEIGKNHYVGVLTLEKVPIENYSNWDDDKWIIEHKSYEPYYIVDGQQRLTTTIILIQAISELLNKKDVLNYTTADEIRKRYIFDSKDNGISRSYIFGYEKDNPSYEFLKTKVFMENSGAAYMKEETIYTHNLLFAKEYFKDKIKEVSKIELEIIFKKITQNLLFNIYSITSDIDVFVAFETMNNRGKPLSNLELLKNRLIYLSTKFDVEESEKIQLRKRINDSWKAVYHYLGRNKERPLKDDFFLMNHFMVYFGHEVRSRTNLNMSKGSRSIAYYRDNYENYLLEYTFSLKNLNSEEENKRLTLETINNYIESLQRSVEIWFSLYNPTFTKDYDDDEKLLLDKLYRIGLGHFAAILLIFYLNKPVKSKRIKLLNTLERFAFISMLTSFRFSTPLWELNDYAIQLSSNRLTTNDLERVISNLTESFLSDNDFLIDLAKRFSNDGFYQWQGIKYFLYEYDLSLKNNSKTKRQKIDWDEYSKDKEDYITIEHIYPQTPKDDCWKSLFNVYSPKERKILNNSLGNLLPLSKPKNSSLQNNCFQKKIDNDVNQIGYRYGSFSEIEISKLEEWSPNDILERGIKLLEFAEKRWQIQLGDRSSKIRILNLGFVK